MRKMILTGALVLFGEGSTSQVVTALAVCVAWLTLIANLKPFGEDVDDRLAQVEALQVLFTLLMGLVLQLQAVSARDSRADDELLGILLVALNCIVVALALVQQPIVRTLADRVCVRPCRRCKNRAVADASAGRDETEAWTEAQAMPKAKGVPSQSNPMRRAELATAAATTRTSGGATAIETSVTMYANPLHRDAASAGGDDIRPHSDGWYYTDVDDPSVLHGPFTLAAFKDWLSDGHFQRSDIVRHGRDGKDVTLSTLVRVAEDGKHYTRAEFVEHAATGEKSWVRPSATPAATLPAEWEAREHEGAPERSPASDVGVEMTMLTNSAFKAGQPSAGTKAATAAEESLSIEMDEWDAGGATRDDIQPHSDGWYYTDVDAVSILHGPVSIAALKDWLDDGHFQRSDLVRHNRDGNDVALSTLVRVAEDGKHYTRAEFVEHFGGTDEWDAGDATLDDIQPHSEG